MQTDDNGVATAAVDIRSSIHHAGGRKHCTGQVVCIRKKLPLHLPFDTF